MAYEALGRLHLAAGRTDAALLTYRQALLSIPSSPGLHYGMGLALAATRNFTGALALHEAAILKVMSDD